MWFVRSTLIWELTFVDNERGEGMGAGSDVVNRFGGGRGSSFPVTVILGIGGRMTRAATTLTLTGVVVALAASTSVALPDGRVYEQVSPPYKNGNLVAFTQEFDFGLAEAGGDAVVYPMSGAAGSAYSGTVSQYVSKRKTGGDWSTEQATPRQISSTFSLASESPTTLVSSANFSRFLFAGLETYVQDGQGNSLNIFLSDNPTHEPQWISRPQLVNPVPGLGEEGASENYTVTGASADLNTIYFGYAGTLLPEDSARESHVQGGHGTGASAFQDAPWGFYEWVGGSLREAGTLPDGELNPFGAVPAVVGLSGSIGRKRAFQAEGFDDWTSNDGSRALFVSPDPIASIVSNPEPCGKKPPCASEPPQLYVREALAGGGHKVTLVSHSMLPGEEGDPAPDGPVSVSNPSGSGATYAFGTPDGSRVFFASTDRLTEAAPADGEVKEYEFETGTDDLTYLPGVRGEIAATGDHGSELAFLNTVTGVLELWRSGSGGGTVTPLAELSGKMRSSQFSSNGSVFVFSTNSQIPGGFNNGGENARGASPLEVYRYDVESAALTCVSCPPASVMPTGDSYTSYNNYQATTNEIRHKNGTNSEPQTTVETRAVSADGDRVFFDTPNVLSPQDTNGVRDVYEWEDGAAHLISSGTGTEASYYLDSSKSGGDVFFATPTGLLSGDTDEAYDVYDARIPRSGDNPAPSAIPCKGSICQGPPSVPQLLGSPASETFDGIGNVASPVGVEALAKDSQPHKVQKKKKKRGNAKKQRVKRHGKKASRNRNRGNQ